MFFTSPTPRPTKPSDDSDDLQDVKLGTGALGTADCKRTSELLSGSLQVSRESVCWFGGKRRAVFFFGGGAPKKRGAVCLDGGGLGCFFWCFFRLSWLHWLHW